MDLVHCLLAEATLCQFSIQAAHMKAIERLQAHATRRSTPATSASSTRAFRDQPIVLRGRLSCGLARPQSHRSVRDPYANGSVVGWPGRFDPRDCKVSRAELSRRKQEMGHLSTASPVLRTLGYLLYIHRRTSSYPAPTFDLVE